MSAGKTPNVWLDDEAEQTLDLIKSAGVAESDAIRNANVGSAARTKLRILVNDPDALEQALEKSQETIAEVFATQRPCASCSASHQVYELAPGTRVSFERSPHR